MSAVGKWGGRIGYVGNLKVVHISMQPPFVHSSNKAWSVPRLLRHSGSGLGGIRGVRGRNAPPTASASAWAAHCAIIRPCIFISFSALEQGGPSGGACPSAIILGCKATLVPFLSVPVGNTGTSFKKAVKSTAYLFRAFLVISIDIILI